MLKNRSLFKNIHIIIMITLTFKGGVVDFEVKHSFRTHTWSSERGRKGRGRVRDFVSIQNFLKGQKAYFIGLQTRYTF